MASIATKYGIAMGLLIFDGIAIFLTKVGMRLWLSDPVEYDSVKYDVWQIFEKFKFFNADPSQLN